jgi:hypothetical protein|tara:strand:- start:1665 stop:1841 length:177 start_codon:yes stop_codon:yes gene_type:complete
MLYQRYGGEHLGINDLKEHTAEGKNDDHGVGFPLMPIFFPVTARPGSGRLEIEKFSLT